MIDVYSKEELLNQSNKTIVNEDEGKYSQETSHVLIILYFILTILWILFAMALGVKPNDTITIILLMIPVLIFSIAIYNCFSLRREQHRSKAAVNLFTVALLATSILVGWKRKDGNSTDNEQFYKMLISGFLLAMISAMDVWTDLQDDVYVIHLKSAAQTMSLTILMIALYWYYVDVTK